MKIGIVWLPNVGKSTMFNALTNNYWADAQNFPFCTIEPNVGLVNVNDPRLEKIRVAVNGAKVIPANCEFTDIAGIVKWASEWEGMGNKFLANIREADAILQVVRIFESSDITHVHGEVNPKNDIEVINMELIIADIESLTKKIVADTKKARSDKDIAEKIKTLQKALEMLEAWSLVSSWDWNNDEKIHLRDSHLLTNKKFVYACNVSEDMMDASQDELKAIIGVSDSETQVVPICAKLEEDMIEMTLIEKKAFLDDMGLVSTGLDNLIKASYDSLWLQYYFTAGEQEVRAWTVKKWATAPQAAGVIHTDFEKWFIKADVVTANDIIEFSGWSGAKEAWKVRLEWKGYIVQDGDVMLFKFNN